MLTISNLHGHGFDRAQLDGLEELGFTLSPEVSTYAGSQLCSFIDFADGPALELIEVTDRSDCASFVSAEMEPYCPGISLATDDGSPAGLDAYERAFADHDRISRTRCAGSALHQNPRAPPRPPVADLAPSHPPMTWVDSPHRPEPGRQHRP